MIERAAVEGKVFHRNAVVELAPDPIRETVPVQLRALMRKELIRPDRPDLAGDESFRFRHLLIRDAAYGALPKEIRAELHARFAGWLSRVAADHLTEYEEILAYHFEQAAGYRTELGLTDAETLRLRTIAVNHLAAAGERALDRIDIAAARKLFESAVRLMPEDDRRGRSLRTRLADTLAKAGQIKAADALLATVIESAAADADELGLAAAELVRVSVAGSLGETPVEQIIGQCEGLVSVFERHGDERSAIRATLELARNHFFAGHAGLAQQMLMRAVDPTQPAQIVVQLSEWLPSTLVWGPMPVAQAVPIVRTVLEGAANRHVEATAEACLGMLHAFVGEFEEGRARVQRAIEIGRDLGMVVEIFGHQGNFLGLLEMLAENYTGAEKMLLEALDGLIGVGEHGFAATVAGTTANLYVLAGRYGEAEHYADMAQNLAATGDVDAQARSLRARARSLAARGETEASLGLARQAQAIVEATDYLNLRGETYSDLAEVLLAAGDLAAARGALGAALAEFEAKGITVEANRTTRRLEQLAVPG